MFQYSFKRFLLLHLFIIIGVYYGNAKEIPTKSTLQVYDYAGILKPNEVEILQRALKDWQDSTSIEMAVVIDKSLEDEDIFEYSLKIAQSWGIGDKSTNNGILLYISAEDKKIFMHIGPGLQGVIPDALGKRIIENILKPAFREQKYGEGIASAILTLQQLAAGTYQGGNSEG
ncbi:MAG: TPM domain-containing protein, partial [Bacteroidota bacterium]